VRLSVNRQLTSPRLVRREWCLSHVPEGLPRSCASRLQSHDPWRFLACFRKGTRYVWPSCKKAPPVVMP
jgi:hypothetical protein